MKKYRCRFEINNKEEDKIETVMLTVEAKDTVQAYNICDKQICEHPNKCVRTGIIKELHIEEI